MLGFADRWHLSFVGRVLVDSSCFLTQVWAVRLHATVNMHVDGTWSGAVGWVEGRQFPG